MLVMILKMLIRNYFFLFSIQDTSSSPTPGAAAASGGTGKEKDTQREILQERIDLYKVLYFIVSYCIVFKKGSLQGNCTLLFRI